MKQKIMAALQPFLNPLEKEGSPLPTEEEVLELRGVLKQIFTTNGDTNKKIIFEIEGNYFACGIPSEGSAIDNLYLMVNFFSQGASINIEFGTEGSQALLTLRLADEQSWTDQLVAILLGESIVNYLQTGNVNLFPEAWDTLKTANLNL